VSARVKKALKGLAAAAFWIIVWQAVSLAVGKELLLPSPIITVRRLFELACGGEFWLSAAFSLMRVLLGFTLAAVFGILLAALTCASPVCHSLFSPLLATVRATPVASFIILALVWLKTGHIPVLMAFLMVLPLVWTNVSQGIREVEREMLEMARVFGFGFWKKLRLIYVPSVMPYFTAACRNGMGMAWKAGIAAEVIAVPARAVGAQIYLSKTYFETADLFAWTAGVVILSMLLEKGMVALFNRLGRRYNTGGGKV